MLDAGYKNAALFLFAREARIEYPVSSIEHRID
jgi:hypothetical protein